MDRIIDGGETWNLPFGPHLMEGNGIPVQLWGPLAAQMGISITAAAQTCDALNHAQSALGGWDIDGIHVTEAIHGSIGDIAAQASRAWHSGGDSPPRRPGPTEEEDGGELPSPQVNREDDLPAQIDQEVDQCPICLERPRPGIAWATLGCGHGMHPPCLEQHRISGTRSYGATEAACPCCRFPITVTSEELFLAGPSPGPPGNMDGPRAATADTPDNEDEGEPLGILLLNTGGGFAQALHSELRKQKH
jgi:hypothetical protein